MGQLQYSNEVQKAPRLKRQGAQVQYGMKWVTESSVKRSRMFGKFLRLLEASREFQRIWEGLGGVRVLGTPRALRFSELQGLWGFQGSRNSEGSGGCEGFGGPKGL